MTVIDLKPKRKRASRALPLEQATDSARFYGRMVRAIESDLGGRRQMTRIETELVYAFCGAATAVNYLNRQIILGEGSEVDLEWFRHARQYNVANWQQAWNAAPTARCNANADGVSHITQAS